MNLSIMIDCETLGLDNNAVIVEVAMVAFNEQFNVVSSVDVKIDALDAILNGFTIDQSVIKFWSNQPKEVVREVLYNSERTSTNDAATIIDKWLSDMVEKSESPLVILANGILFDVPKVDNLLSQAGYKKLTDRIHYNLVLDYRTMRTIAKSVDPNFGEIEKKVAEKYENRHVAITDCLYQIDVLKEITKTIDRDPRGI